MKFWAFDAKYFNQDNSLILLKSGRKVWISEGDKIILFNRAYNGIIFQSSAIVRSTILKDLGDRSIYHHLFQGESYFV